MSDVPTDARLGRLIPAPDATAALPPIALGMALRSHARTHWVDGEPWETRHSWDGTLFRLRTDGARGETRVWLERGRG